MQIFIYYSTVTIFMRYFFQTIHFIYSHYSFIHLLFIHFMKIIIKILIKSFTIFIKNSAINEKLSL